MSRTLVLSRIYPPQIGGSGRWMHELYRRLPNLQPLVIAARCEGDKEYDRQNVDVLEVKRANLDLPSWGVTNPLNLLSYLSTAKEIAEIIQGKTISQIHAACCLPEGLLAWYFAKRLGVPYYTYVHGEELNVAASSRELSWLARRVFHGARSAVANSHNTASLLAKGWLPVNERPQVLTPGVDTEYFHPAGQDDRIRDELGWTDRRVILTVGRLQKRKGHDMMLRALPAIQREVPNVLYAIAGEGDERHNLQQLASDLSVNRLVRFHDALEADLLLAANQQCDLFILPNREVEGDIEGFGIVLLEAQACGKPVIAGGSGGTCETLVDGVTGCIVDANSPENLAACVLKLLKQADKLQGMGQAARDWTVSNFDWRELKAQAQSMFAGRLQEACVNEATTC